MAITKAKKSGLTSSAKPAFDVALSFAGEDRDYVSKTAEFLKLMGIRVFYDKYEQVTLWGKNLYDHLSNVYRDTSRYTVMFISKHYARKLWTNLERQSAQARAFVEGRECILPVRFDDTEIPGVHATVGYISLKNLTPRNLAELIKQKIGPIPRENFMPDYPDRLLALLGVETEDERHLITSVAEDIFSSLSLMTPQERKLVSILAMNTCPTGPAVDNDIHININLLARLSGIDRRTIIAMCSRIECLKFFYEMTSHSGKDKRKDILRLTYEPLYIDEVLSGNWTAVLYGIFACLGESLCAECSEAAVERLDFSVLSTLAGFPDVHTSTVISGRSVRAGARSPKQQKTARAENGKKTHSSKKTRTTGRRGHKR
jgi:hypothetical protein